MIEEFEERLERNSMELALLNFHGKSATDWAIGHSNKIDHFLSKNGALLIRNVNVHSSAQFSRFLKNIFKSELLDYVYRSTPRKQLKGKVYTATDYPEYEYIPQHNENSYSNKWVMRLGFFCMLPARKGGETPIADSRKVYSNIPYEIREKFERKNVMYVRNYGELDLPWQEVFQTDKKEHVELFCRSNRLQYDWIDQTRLRTKQINPAVALHPYSKEKVWFNQAHLFHVSSLRRDISERLLSNYEESDLPRNAYYGDGEAIEEEVLDVIRKVYVDLSITFNWQKNDILLLDNMLYSHGRNPYEGARKVLVGMANEHGY